MYGIGFVLGIGLGSEPAIKTTKITEKKKKIETVTRNFNGNPDPLEPAHTFSGKTA